MSPVTLDGVKGRFQALFEGPHSRTMEESIGKVIGATAVFTRAGKTDITTARPFLDDPVGGGNRESDPSVLALFDWADRLGLQPPGEVLVVVFSLVMYPGDKNPVERYKRESGLVVEFGFGERPYINLRKTV